MRMCHLFLENKRVKEQSCCNIKIQNKIALRHCPSVKEKCFGSPLGSGCGPYWGLGSSGEGTGGGGEWGRKPPASVSQQ